MPNFKSKRYISDEYRTYVKTLSCLVPGCGRPVDAHHDKTVGAGGSDLTCIPLCGGVGGHHAEIGTVGRLTFYERYDVDIKSFRIMLLEGYIEKRER